MNTFRYSTLSDRRQLIDALHHIHLACHRLCNQSLGLYLPVAGNIGIFSHNDDEYERLKNLQSELTDLTKSVYGKYFLLHEPVTFPVYDGIPEATYTHLYIRKPDVKKPHVGDLDFYLSPPSFANFKQKVQNGTVPGARLLDRTDIDLVELFDPDIDALGYVGDKLWRETV